MKTLPLLLFLTTGAGFAAEAVKLPLELGTLKTPLKTYEGARMTGSDSVGIRIIHEGGTARIPYERLPRQLADRVTPDAASRAAARGQLAREEAQQDAYHHAMAVAVQQRLAEEAAKPPGKSITKLAMDTQRMMELQEYVSRLKAGVAEAQIYIKKRQERAARVRVRSYYRSYGYYGNNCSSGRRVYFILRMAERKQAKVDQAQALIEKAEEEMAYLDGAR